MLCGPSNKAAPANLYGKEHYRIPMPLTILPLRLYLAPPQRLAPRQRRASAKSDLLFSKESGSLIASSHGIEAARQHLGHRDIRTTSSHYVDKKKRIEVSLPIRATVGILAHAP